MHIACSAVAHAHAEKTPVPKWSLRDFLSLRHPNHFVFAGANNRNVIIAYRFLAAPVQANRDFFKYTDCIFELYGASSGFRPEAKSLRGQL